MNNESNERLSPGARALLSELVSDLQDRVIAQAELLNPGDILTARDITDGFRAVQAKERDPDSATYRLPQRLRWSRVLVMYAAAAGIAAISAGVIGVLGSVLDVSGVYLNLTVTALALMAGVFAFSIVLLALRESRVSRVRALEHAENARDAHRAMDAAEATALAAARTTSNSSDVLLPRFISQWARLEDRLRRLAQVALGMPAETAADYPIGGILRDLIRVGILEPRRGEDLQDILDIRNMVAHGRTVSPTDLSVGVRLMERLEKFLDDNIAEQTFT